MTFSGIVEKIQPKDIARMWARCAAWALCIASACCVQAMQAPGIPPAASRVRPVAKIAQPASKGPVTAEKRAIAATDEPSTPPPSSSDAVARPARLSLKDGKLTIAANNSDLSQILRGVAAASGMTIDGLGKSARVFGTYGPGNPRDVLTELLAGSGYNFMMAGDTPDGAPRELLLTAENTSAPVPIAAAGGAATPATPAGSDVDAPEKLGPGAIAHVPPSERQDPADDNSEQDNERVQNNLRRLEQIHSALEQQSAPQ